MSLDKQFGEVIFFNKFILRAVQPYINNNKSIQGGKPIFLSFS